MNTSQHSSQDLAAIRDREARRRTGQPAATASQRAAVDAAEGMVEVVKSARVEPLEKVRNVWTDRCEGVTIDTDDDGTVHTGTCGAFLSAYNKGTVCAPCQRRIGVDIDAIL